MKKKLLAGLATGLFLFGMVGMASATSATSSFNGNTYGVMAKVDGQYWYADYDDKYSWTQANDAAQALGGHLVTISDAAEWNFVQTIADFGGNLFMGGYQHANASSPNSNWAGVDGTAWDYTDWASGEPNDFNFWDWHTYYGNYENNYENYLVSWNGGTAWNDASDSPRGFIYEIEGENPVPEPATMLLFGTGLAGLAGVSIRRRKKA